MANTLRQFLNYNTLENVQRYIYHQQWNGTGLKTSFYATLHPKKSGRPKQPVNAYLLYLKEQQRDATQSQTQFVSAAAQRWREMSSTEKEPFIDHQRELALKYRAELESFNSSLSKMDKEAHLEEFRKNKLKRQKRIQKKERLLTDPPKRNASAWAFFIKSRFNSMKIDSTREGANLLKDATALWGGMHEDQKRPFITEAAEDKERYIREMQDYIQRMKDEGKLHLLPGKYQKMADAEKRKASKAKK